MTALDVAAPEAAPTTRRPLLQRPAVPIALGFLVVVDQLRFLIDFARRFVNEDATVLWYAARDFGQLRFFQPGFYGQRYFTMFEAISAEVLRWIGFGPGSATTVATAACWLPAWFVLSWRSYVTARPIAAVAAVVIPVAVSIEYLIAAEIPGGRGAGIALMMAALCVVDVRNMGLRRSTIVVAACSLAVVWNQAMALPAVAAVSWLVLLDRRPARLARLAVGLVPAAAYQFASMLFFRSHPTYDLHRGPDATPSLTVLRHQLAHPDRLFTILAPEIARHWSIAVLSIIAVAGAAMARRRAITVVPAAVVLLGIVAAAASPKAEDGAATPYLSFGRLLIGMPMALWFLVLITEGVPSRRSAKPRELAVPTRTILLGGMAVLATVSFVARAVQFTERTERIAAASRHSQVVPVSITTELYARCDRLHALAASAGADVVVFRYDRTAAYGCGALWYGGLTALFPEYDRRTWLLEDWVQRPTARLVVTETEDGWCADHAADVESCTVVDDKGTAVIESAARPLGELLRAIGIPIRPL